MHGASRNYRYVWDVSVTHYSLHLRHGHLISVLLFRSMSFVAHCIHLVTVISLNISQSMIACVHREQHNYISRSSPEKFGMTFPNNAWEHAESAPEICRNGNESTFRQNIGHSRFTYTSNHHKLHIYIKPPQASHIHQTQASHIQQTPS